MRRLLVRFSLALLASLAMGSAAVPVRASPATGVAAVPNFGVLSIGRRGTITPMTAGPCSCVDYVQNDILGPTGVYAASDLNWWLPQHGWWKDRGGNTPGWGDVMVFSPGAYYADPNYGHTAIVQTSSRNADGSWSVTMRSAHWSVGGAYFTDHNCTNVRLTTFTYYGDSGITFWRNW